MYPEALMGWYDFLPPKFFYRQAIPDIGVWGNDMNGLTLNFVNNDPIYIDG